MRKVWCNDSADLEAVTRYLGQNDITTIYSQAGDRIEYESAYFNPPVGFCFDETTKEADVFYGRAAFDKFNCTEIVPGGIAYLVDDPVNHPSHYTGEKVECIVAMERVFGKEAVISFSILNAWKYLWRRKGKGNEKQDVKKALWYFDKAKELLNDSTE